MIVFTGEAVLPFLYPDAGADLALAAAAGGAIEINSAFRSVAQQYLIYRWYQAGRCGITAAAPPGDSNDESGRAIDVDDWMVRRAALEAHGGLRPCPATTSTSITSPRPTCAAPTCSPSSGCGTATTAMTRSTRTACGDPTPPRAWPTRPPMGSRAAPDAMACRIASTRGLATVGDDAVADPVRR